jgi:hypothetical protein
LNVDTSATVEVSAAFVQPGDTIIHPTLCVPVSISRIERFPATGRLQVHYNEPKSPSKLREASRVRMLVEVSAKSPLNKV